MKQLFFDISSEECKQFKSAFPNDEIICFESSLNKDSIPQEHTNAELISAFICSSITNKVIDSFPNLKLILTRSTGFNHIDMKAAKERSIIVCNTPSYASITVAEHTFALIFALARKLFESCERTKNKQFFCKGITPFDLHGKTLGIVGLGAIGKRVATIAQAFGMEVIAYDPYAKDSAIQLVTLPTLLEESDIISLHAPLNDETHHIINDTVLKLMKPSAYIINTARGELIDTASLVKAIKNNTIAGAALDVLEDECALKNPSAPDVQNDTARLQLLNLNHVLLNSPNIIITPHSAFFSAESINRRTQQAIDTIKAFKIGNPTNAINKH